MSMTQTLGEASGVRPEFEINGVRCAVGHPTPAAKARYESLIVAAEKRVVESMAADGLITREERAAMYAELTRAVSFDKAHAVGGSLWQKYNPTGSRASTGGVLFVLTALEVFENGNWRHATIRDYDLAQSASTDPAAVLCFAEVLPGFLRAVLTDPRIPEGVRENAIQSATDAMRSPTSS